MTSINPFGARPYTSTSSPLADNKQQSPVSKSANAPVKVPAQDQVALSSNGIDLQQRIVTALADAILIVGSHVR